MSVAISARPLLEIEKVQKTYGTEVRALQEVSLDIADGEFVTLLGPSGSGKTTLLMVIAGFERPTSGRVLAKGEDITVLPPERRNLGIVFQSYALFPHMSVRQNISYPLEVRHVARDERRRLIDDALKLVDLDGLGDRRPGQLSGGQQQRVALARALVYRPSVLLLDEPLGALDRALRERVQSELKLLHRKVGLTFVYVTHDQDEALTMSDRVVVMRNGLIEQVGTPHEVYTRPANRFVASFVGRANLLPGHVVSRSGDLVAVQTGQGAPVSIPAHADVIAGSAALVVLRPEHTEIVASVGPDEPAPISGTVTAESFAGSVWRYMIGSPGGATFHSHMSRRADVKIGQNVLIRWAESEAWAIPAGSSTVEGREP